MGATNYASLTLTEKDHAAFETALKKAATGNEYPVYAPDPVYHPNSMRPDTNPANTAQVLARFSEATLDDVNTAVAAARRACAAVERLGWEGRAELLKRAATLIERKKYLIAAILTLEAGKTRGEAFAEVNEVVAMIETYTTFARECGYYRYTLNEGTEAPYEFSVSTPRPLGGPVAVISPFNFPFALPAGMSIAELFVGNPMILKPASETPLATLAWRDILVEAGLPGEACPFLVGPGSTVGEALLRHPGIAGIAFTGSLEVGKRIVAAHAELYQSGIFRAWPVMELGGKNPVIVTTHANIEHAAEGILRGAVGFGGQKCSATSRMYAVKPIAPVLLERILAMAKNGLSNGTKITVDDPQRRSAFLGPLIDETARNRYLRIVKELRGLPHAKTYQICAAPPAADMKNRGYFVTPLLATGVPHDDPLNKEEHFVPIVLLHEVDTLEEAVAKANDSVYGLCAGLFSEDDAEIAYFLHHVEAGVVYANRKAGATTGAWPGTQTFGGWKGSGTSGKNAFGKWYPLNFTREQVQTTVKTPQSS